MKIPFSQKLFSAYNNILKDHNCKLLKIINVE